MILLVIFVILVISRILPLSLSLSCTVCRALKCPPSLFANCPSLTVCTNEYCNWPFKLSYLLNSWEVFLYLKFFMKGSYASAMRLSRKYPSSLSRNCTVSFFFLSLCVEKPTKRSNCFFAAAIFPTWCELVRYRFKPYQRLALINQGVQEQLFYFLKRIMTFFKVDSFQTELDSVLYSPLLSQNTFQFDLKLNATSTVVG